MSNRPQRGQRRDPAWAPYNFVPLPPTVIPAEPLPDRNAFDLKRHTGYFDVRLITETPLFIRGMLSATDKVAGVEAKDRPDAFTVDGQQPILPGSSLRGMLRSLVEIITFSKMHFVSNRQKMFYRAVAADRNDPLKDPYATAIGRFGRNVQAGYLRRDGENWVILPAQRFSQREAYGKVPDKTAVVEAVRGLKRFNDPQYEVQWHEVLYNRDRDRVQAVRSPGANETATAALICTGNMLETGGGNASPRRKYALLLPPARNEAVQPIPATVIEDYIDGLSPFLKEPPFDPQYGLLGENRTRWGTPVFYIKENGVVAGFGHTPNFRIASLIGDPKQPRVVNPSDLVPDDLLNPNLLDMAEALFGYVDRLDDEGRKISYASRINVTSAHLELGQTNVLHDELLARTPGSPKPSTFQHYLEQPDGVDTPKVKLHHFGTRGARIRGHKLYWRQKTNFERLKAGNSDGSKPKIETQFRPVKAGVAFTFRVYFENLTTEELGAIAWVLTLGDDPDARHMLGMGKPYGLGVVQLTADLHRSNREARYDRLFAGSDWATGIDPQPEPLTVYIDAFLQRVQDQTGTVFHEHPRIQELLTMLRLRQPSPQFAYMSIQNERGDNEFKDRPVLPRPGEVVNRSGW